MLSRTGSGQTHWRRPPRCEVSEEGVTLAQSPRPHFLVLAQEEGEDTGQGIRIHQVPTHPTRALKAGHSGAEWGQGLSLTSGGENQANDGEETQATRRRHLWGEPELGSAMMSLRRVPAAPTHTPAPVGILQPLLYPEQAPLASRTPARADSWFPGQREGSRSAGRPWQPPPSSVCRPPKKTRSIRPNGASSSSHCTGTPLGQRRTYPQSTDPTGPRSGSGGLVPPSGAVPRGEESARRGKRKNE